MKNFYGTPRAQLEEKLLCGDVFLDIEPNGAFNVRAQRPDAVLIFIAPPSHEELERRLRSRGDTPQDQIEVRLTRAKWEMEQSKQYDYIVINDQVETCANEILNIVGNN
jgi:guanylate kinase